MKRSIYIMVLTGMLWGSGAICAAEGNDPVPMPPQDRPGMRPVQGQGLNPQQRMERWMEQMNKAYEAKDFQRMDRLIQRYAAARQNISGPLPGPDRMQPPGPLNQQGQPFAQGRRQRPGRMPDQNLPERPGAQAFRPGQGRGQAMAPRQGQGRQFRYGRGMGQEQQRWAQRPMPYARSGNFRQQMRRWALNHPQAFGQFRGQEYNQPGRWNRGFEFRPQRNWQNPGAWRNFWADEFR